MFKVRWDTYKTLIPPRIGHQRHAHLGHNAEIALAEDATVDHVSFLSFHHPFPKRLNSLAIRSESIRKALQQIISHLLLSADKGKGGLGDQPAKYYSPAIRPSLS